MFDQLVLEAITLKVMFFVQKDPLENILEKSFKLMIFILKDLIFVKEVIVKIFLKPNNMIIDKINYFHPQVP